jgi:hypothetical protein
MTAGWFCHDCRTWSGSHLSMVSPMINHDGSANDCG